MLVRLVAPTPDAGLLYELVFPCVLPLDSLIPGAAIPAAWSSQLQILTSFLQLDPPSSIHMLDRAVGLVARTHEVSMDVVQKEITVNFVDGRVVNIPMNSDCVRILMGAVLDIKSSNELERQRNSIEGSACPGSIAGSAEDIPSGPTRSPKLGKHKRQRSLLFSLISSLVPKSLSSSSSSSPPPTAPPPTPLPPLPIVSRVSSPVSPQQTSFSSNLVEASLLRRRARSILFDVWRRHIITALAPQHLPAAGYTEWTLIAMASRVRAELESVKTMKRWSHDDSVSNKNSSRNKHRRAQSEGRNALDFGDRSEEDGLERCRAPSPFQGMWDAEDIDQVVYPRRGQADEWGVRYADYSSSSDVLDIFELEFNGHNDSLLAEHFLAADDWDDNEQVTFELNRLQRGAADMDIRSSSFGDRHLRTADLDLDDSDDHGSKLADTAFDMSRVPLVPSDVYDGEESDEMSLRTPEDGEELPLVNILQDPPQLAIHSTPKSSSVSRVTSTRPRPRSAPATRHAPHTDPRDAQLNEIIYSHCEQLDRICTALEIVRSRAREEGWRLIKATTIGAKNRWLDAETERTLEMKAKRRAWSSGIKIHAPYISNPPPRAWNSSLSILRRPKGPPGLTSSLKGTSQIGGPIVPTGLSLGIPLQSSPLAQYVWGVGGRHTTTPGILNTLRSTETVEGKRPPRVTFADSVTKLFPVCEDESEDLVEPVQVGFPPAVPPPAPVDESVVVEGPVDNERDPFCFYPPRQRTRTSSITPPPSYQAAVGGDVSTATSEEKALDPSALLLQPLSSLSTPPLAQSPSSRPPLTSNSPFIPRPRAVSLPTIRPCLNTNKTRRTSLRHEGERYEDLSRTYAVPPPEGPLVITASPAPHEEYPRYAHMPLPKPSRKGMNASILGRTSREVVFEQAGSEFTVGLEVALGRAEEGRVVW